MDVTALIGRIVLSLMFIMSAMNHFTKRSYMAEYASSRGVPMAGLAVPVSGVMALAGGVFVALGIWGDLGAALLLAFLVPTTVMMHGPWRFDDPEERQQQQMHFMKNVTMIGGTLLALALFVGVGDDLGLTLTGPLFV